MSDEVRQLSEMARVFGRDNRNLLAALMYFISSIIQSGREDVFKELVEFAHKCSARANELANEDDSDDILSANEISEPSQ